MYIFSVPPIGKFRFCQQGMLGLGQKRESELEREVIVLIKMARDGLIRSEERVLISLEGSGQLAADLHIHHHPPTITGCPPLNSNSRPQSVIRYCRRRHIYTPVENCYNSANLPPQSITIPRLSIQSIYFNPFLFPKYLI